MNPPPAHPRFWQGLYLTLLTTVALLAGALLLNTARPVAGQPAALAAAPGATASATPICLTGWDIIPSPNNGSGYNTLAAVTSISPTDVWAVGSYQTSNATHPLALHWDGTVWTSVPITGTGTNNNLLGVSASATNDVWAVGTSDGSTFIQHWNGSTWQIVSSPNGGPNGNFLYGVAALGTTKVWAVGYSFDSNNVQQLLSEYWDGTAWTVVPVPAVGNGGYLIGVSALANDNIWAVGAYIDGGGHDQPLTVHWDGTAWTVIGVALSGEAGSFRSVAAISNTDVWAVGSYQAFSNGPWDVLVMHWDGTFWDFVPAPTFGTVSNLQSVAASNSHDVWMVGSYSDGNVYQNLILHWDGGSMIVMNSPNLGSGTNVLTGVVARADSTWAVGLGDGNRTLTERYSLRCLSPTPTATVTPPCSTGWGVISSPNVLTASNTLNGVTASSPADAWVVGSSGNAAQTLALRWNGAYWLTVSSPNGGGTSNELLGVTALAANDVWAVGYTNAPQAQTLVVHWDGISWVRVPSPNVGTLGSRLFGVAARSVSDVWAVGSYVAPSGDEQTLIEHWDGNIWSVVPSPNGDPEGSFLRGISLIAADDIWAVGYTAHHDPPTPTATATTLAGMDPAAPDQPQHGFESLLLHWDGTAWSLVEGPDLGVTDSHYLWGVTAVSTADVWAVGYVGDTTQENLILHWDGSEWSRVPSPNAGTVSNNLRSVTAAGPNDVWAAGWYINNAAVKQTLLLHWDGSAWTLVLPPNVNTGNNTFYGISASGANNIWAVGFASAATGPTQTLTERYTGPCASPTPTRTATPSPSPTATVCPMQFVDVPVGSTFYDVIRCLACRGVISGYPCGGPGEPCPGTYYRVGNNVTRGQTAKIVASSARFTEPVPSTQQTYEDLPPSGTFWLWVERLSGRGIVSGYPCGANAFEPCVAPGNRPYFRPNNPVTRGQLAKIGANAAGYTETPTGQTFEDAPPGSTFYLFIERLASRGIMSGYPCGSAGEPCVAPGNRPYFRPGGTATRGQTAKIVANTFYPNCQTPARRR